MVKGWAAVEKTNPIKPGNCPKVEEHYNGGPVQQWSKARLLLERPSPETPGIGSRPRSPVTEKLKCCLEGQLQKLRKVQKLLGACLGRLGASWTHPMIAFHAKI